MQVMDIAHSLDQADFPDLDTLQGRYGWGKRTHRVFDRMFGLKSTALHPDLSLTDGLMMSAKRLAQRNPELIGHVDVVLYAHALNTSLPHERSVLMDIAQDVFGSTPEVMSVTHGSCASAIMGLQLLRAMPRETPLNIVLLTGEKCFFEVLNYADNNGLFGEVTSAVFLRHGSDLGLQVKATTAGVFDGVYAPLAKADKEVTAAYDKAFLPTITAAAAQVMVQADLGPDQIDLILPTHLSPFTFNRVAEQLGIDSSKVVKQNLSHIGHCFCGDLFINFETWQRSDLFQAANDRAINVLSFAAGMTGSYAAIILTQEPTQ